MVDEIQQLLVMKNYFHFLLAVLSSLQQCELIKLKLDDGGDKERVRLRFHHLQCFEMPLELRHAFVAIPFHYHPSMGECS